ncbi:DUF6538 domain-containing protein [Thioclava sediminum]|uniref:DUF6538 domain-containing protein n=1 Tax=Thioclava sediminum TaxID=1915319 RepID=UPI003CC5EF82
MRELHPGGATGKTYYFRMRVPNEFTDVEPLREINRSLKTRDSSRPSHAVPSSGLLSSPSGGRVAPGVPQIHELCSTPRSTY